MSSAVRLCGVLLILCPTVLWAQPGGRLESCRLALLRAADQVLFWPAVETRGPGYIVFKKSAWISAEAVAKASRSYDECGLPRDEKVTVYFGNVKGMNLREGLYKKEREKFLRENPEIRRLAHRARMTLLRTVPWWKRWYYALATYNVDIVKGANHQTDPWHIHNRILAGVYPMEGLGTRLKNFNANGMTQKEVIEQGDSFPGEVFQATAQQFAVIQNRTGSSGPGVHSSPPDDENRFLLLVAIFLD